MSYTELYRLSRDPGELAEFQNAWLGAMAIWGDLARRYCGLDMFPMYGPGQKQVWGLTEDPRLSMAERVTLLSTMDNAAVRGVDALKLADAFEGYSSVASGDNHFGKQAAFIRKAVADGDIQPGDWLAYNQTSVNCDRWFSAWNDEREDYDYYDPNTGDKHFDVFAEATAAIAA